MAEDPSGVMTVATEFDWIQRFQSVAFWVAAPSPESERVAQPCAGVGAAGQSKVNGPMPVAGTEMGVTCCANAPIARSAKRAVNARSDLLIS